jgi:glycosyltransferase involved in cell wall biosynthesis
MHFGWARRQGIRLATSDYICIIDNDLLYKPKWLSQTIAPLFKYPDRKFITTPYISPDKLRGKNPRGTLDGYRLNSMAGSNCMIMKKTDYYYIQEFTTHHFTGSHWHRKMNQNGYVAVAPPIDLADHMGFRIGYNYTRKIQVKKTLMGNKVADYTFPYTK